jgi:hypothetical protein
LWRSPASAPLSATRFSVCGLNRNLCIPNQTATLTNEATAKNRFYCGVLLP